MSASSDEYSDGSGNDERRAGSRVAPARGVRQDSKPIARLARPTRGIGLSRGPSADGEAGEGTPGGSGPEYDDEEEEGEGEGEGDGGDGGEEEGENEEDPEPVELDVDDMDPINSGAVTPAVGAPVVVVKPGKRAQFAKRKETKQTIKGQVYTIVDDEITLDVDLRGEAKIDADGVLLGGRKFKLNSFTSPHRSNPNKHYMLSIDAARAAGFRDSLYFFRRNPLIHKLSCSQSEKDRLIELGKLSGNLKSRAVTMVSAKNCFKVMGATFIQNGKYVFDDYYEDQAIAAGHTPGEPAWIETYDPEKDTGTLAAAKGPMPAGATGTGLNTLLGHAGKPRPTTVSDPRGAAPREDYISSTVGGGANTFGGNGLQPFGKSYDSAAKKVKPAPHLTNQNWMMEYAKSVVEANKELAVVRARHIGQVQVGLNVIEPEEDMLIEVDVEDEVLPEEGGAADGIASTSAMDLDAQDLLHLSNASTSLHTPVTANHFFGTPAAELSRAGTPSRKRKIKVYNPIRGIYEPETNVPHVYSSTQPTRAVVERVGLAPHLYDANLSTGEDDTAGPNEKSRRRKLEHVAGGLGVVTFEYVVDEGARGQAEQLLPGMPDFLPLEIRGSAMF